MRKRNHHYIPKLYLRGFTESKDSAFLWEYVRGKEYEPGLKYGRSNPCRRSVNFAGMERDVFAYQDRAGNTDFDQFENKLEKLEKPADPIFHKIRNFEPITESDKQAFSKYLVLLDRRVPARDDRVENMWPDALEKLKVGYDATGDSATDAKLLELKEEYERLLAELKTGPMPKEIKLQTMIAESKVARIMSEMRWQFLIAPEGRSFLTSDNPVFYFEGYGIKPPLAEVSVPISSAVAIGMSWSMKLPEGYFRAKDRSVDEINRRSAFNAEKHIYMAKKARWALDLLNKSEHKLGRLFGL